MDCRVGRLASLLARTRVCSIPFLQSCHRGECKAVKLYRSNMNKKENRKNRSLYLDTMS